MIKSIEIKNFKCFDNLRLPLSKLTILAGANAAGKSTVMQALLLAEATAREKGNSVDASEALGPKPLFRRIEQKSWREIFFFIYNGMKRR